MRGTMSDLDVAALRTHVIRWKEEGEGRGVYVWIGMGDLERLIGAYERVAKLERTGRAFLEEVKAGRVRDYTTDEREPLVGNYIHPDFVYEFEAALDEGKRNG
jgi:hypothetical protein